MKVLALTASVCMRRSWQPWWRNWPGAGSSGWRKTSSSRSAVLSSFCCWTAYWSAGHLACVLLLCAAFCSCLFYSGTPFEMFYESVSLLPVLLPTMFMAIIHSGQGQLKETSSSYDYTLSIHLKQISKSMIIHYKCLKQTSKALILHNKRLKQTSKAMIIHYKRLKQVKVWLYTINV